MPFVRACLEILTTLTFRTPQENHIVSVPFDTIEKKQKICFSIFLESPGHLGTIQNLIPGWTTIVKLLKQVKNGQSPSRDPWSNCLINSRETTKGQINYYSGRHKDNSKTICGRAGYHRIYNPILTYKTDIREGAGDRKVVWCKCHSGSLCMAVERTSQMDSGL